MFPFPSLTPNLAARVERRLQATIADYSDGPPIAVQRAINALETSALGSQLVELLQAAEDVWLPAARRANEFRARCQTYTLDPEARLAEAILNALGPPRECYAIYDLAGRLADEGEA